MVEGAFGSESARRREAVRLVCEEGLSKAATARQLGRSREWVHKWLRRYRIEGEVGLGGQSRAPRSRPQALEAATVAKVIEVRKRLTGHPFASIGGVAILAELERDGFEPLPSVSSIERIIKQAGLVRRSEPTRQRGRLPLPEVHLPGVWQQIDWIQDRYLTGGIRFQSLQITDVGSHGMAADQYLRRTVRNAATFLTDQAWPRLSIPAVISVDNAFVKTTHRLVPWTEFVRTCLFFGTEVLVAPPGHHGWTNQAEALNHLWQDRVLWRHHFTSLEQLRTTNQEACHWFNHHRPVLDPARHGTRYPHELINQHRHRLTWPPAGFNLTDHIDTTNTLTLPLSAGRLTYLRHVTEHHTITLAGAHWPLHNHIPIGSLVAATITTADHTLTIRHQQETITTHPFPIKHPIHDPYYPNRPHPVIDQV